MLQLTWTRYGVSRVYLQQCGYVLADAQHLQVQLRRSEKATKTVTNDVETGRAAK